MMVLVVASCGTELEEVPKEAETFVRIEQKVLLAGNDYSYDTWHASGLNQTEINNRSGLGNRRLPEFQPLHDRYSRLP